MITRPLVVALSVLVTLLLGTIPGCQSGPRSSTPRPGAPAEGQAPLAADPTADAPASPIFVESSAPPVAEPRWTGTARSSGGRRVALLVGADRYANPAWNIDVADDTVEHLRDVLVETLHFAPGDVITVSGDAVYEKNIEAKIDQLTRDLSGIDNTLLVAWVGHGFEIQGRQQFLTALSRGGGSSGFTETIPYDAVLAWIGNARHRLRDAGGELQTAMIVDACRTPTGGTPGRIRDHEPVLDVEVFGARMGTPTTYGPESFVFTGALSRSLARARGSRVGLLDAVRDAEQFTLDELRGTQEPDVLTGTRDVVLLDSSNLAITVRAVDQISESAVDGAVIELRGERKPGPQAVFTGLDASSTGYFLRIEAPGYFPRQTSITVSTDKSGQSLIVPLQPEYVELSGYVSLTGTGSPRVEVTGDFPGLVKDYHVASGPVARETGAFVLRVPRTAGPRQLLVKIGERIVYDEAFDLATREKRTAQNKSGVIFDHYSFGRLRIETVGPLDIGAHADRQIVDGFAFDWSTISEQELGGGIAWSFYLGARDHAEASDYEAAIFRLERLHKEVSVSQATDRKLGELVERLEIARVITLANAMQKSDLDGAIEVLLASPARNQSEVRDELRGWLMESAGTLYAAGDYERSAERLRQASDAGWPVAEIRTQLAQVLHDWITDAYEQALSTGDWSGPRRAVAVLEDARIDGVQAREWKARIERESISPASRRHYEDGLQHVDAGDLELAMASFDAARAEGCNDHYRALIQRHQDGIRGDALNRRLAAGRRLEQEGKIPDAFDEYLQAARISTLAMAYVEPLLANPSHVAVLSAERADALLQVQSITIEQDMTSAARAEERKDHAAAAKLYAQAAATFEALGDARGAARALHGQARCADPFVNTSPRSASWPDSVELYGRAARAYEQAGDAAAAAECFYLHGWGMAFEQNPSMDLPRAATILADTARRFADLGDREGQAKALLYQGRSVLAQSGLDGRFDLAKPLFVESAELFAAAAVNDHLRGEALFGVVCCLLNDTRPGDGPADPLDEVLDGAPSPRFGPRGPLPATAEACQLLDEARKAKQRAGKTADAQQYLRIRRALNCR